MGAGCANAAVTKKAVQQKATEAKYYGEFSEANYYATNKLSMGAGSAHAAFTNKGYINQKRANEAIYAISGRQKRTR